jgi:hypothetical protein
MRRQRFSRGDVRGHAASAFRWEPPGAGTARELVPGEQKARAGTAGANGEILAKTYLVPSSSKCDVMHTYLIQGGEDEPVGFPALLHQHDLPLPVLAPRNAGDQLDILCLSTAALVHQLGD